jgi:hypothetical protein
MTRIAVDIPAMRMDRLPGFQVRDVFFLLILLLGVP